ncbi:beta-propeller fold lactonase family protein, partial [Staphylococcus epidermidis]|uniref:beta-propeller fold lactonase family protein n=1 Tax=Staphylococcus epidermidis TaxID=1282 RepID=UPI00119FEDC3
PRICKLNRITRAIEKLIQQLQHEFPTPSHQTQHSSHLHFLNQTPHHNYLLPTHLRTHTLLTYKFPHHRLKQYPLSQFKNSHPPPHIP